MTDINPFLMTVELKFNLQGLYTNTSSAIITAELSY